MTRRADPGAAAGGKVAPVLPGSGILGGGTGWHLAGRVTLGLGALGAGFVTLSAIRTWSVSDATVGGYTGAMLVGEAAGMLILGALADRRGHKLSLQIAALCYAAAFALTAWSPGSGVYIPAFVLIGMGLGGQITSGIMLTLEFARRADSQPMPGW
jgi:MFS family permease